jgi:hypothetical protein
MPRVLSFSPKTVCSPLGKGDHLTLMMSLKQRNGYNTMQNSVAKSPSHRPLNRWALWRVVAVQVVGLIVSFALFIQLPLNISTVVSDILFPLVILIYFFANKSIRTVLFYP